MNFTAENTGNNMSVLIPYSIVLTGSFTEFSSIPDGSMIGAFYSTNDQLLGAGFDVWNKTTDLSNGVLSIGVEVYGDDETTTSSIEGFISGDIMTWMLLTPNGLLYALQPTYDIEVSSARKSEREGT